MKEFLFEGNINLMGFLLLLGSIILILGIIFVIRKLIGKKETSLDQKLLFSIPAVGSFTFLCGLLFQIMGLYMAFQAIKLASEISPPVLMKGIFLSFYTTILGLAVFMVSFILWYVFKLVFGFKNTKLINV